MPARESKGSKTDPYYLAAPVGWQTAMEVKRRFSSAEPPIPVVGAASVEAAMGRLESNPRCVAVLLHFAEQPQQAIELICRIKERWKRPVVAFHPRWHRDDVRRALQLGADCLLSWPFEPIEVLGDLEALHTHGISVTRGAILKQGGPALLTPDPALWVENDDDWRARLGSLAERLRTPAANEPARVTRIDPSVNFSRAAGGKMTPALAGATMTVLRTGAEHIARIAGEYQVEQKTLEKTVEVGLQASEEARATMLAWLDDLSRKGAEDAETSVMAQLRRAAQVTLQANGARAGEIDVLANALSAATGVPVAALEGLSPSTRVTLSSRLVGNDDADDALQAVRMMVLVSMVSELGTRTPDAHDLAALTALLGLRAGVEGVRPGDLVRALARLDPPAALHGLDLQALAPVREAIPVPGNALDQLLRRAIDELVKAVAPFGYIDQNRLVALLRASRQGSSLVGATTWHTVTEVVSRRRTSTDPRAVKIMTRLDRVLAIGGNDARARLVRALEDLLASNRKVMDAGRFIAFCRNAATGVGPEGSISRPAGAAVSAAALASMSMDGPGASVSISPGTPAGQRPESAPPSAAPAFDPTAMLADVPGGPTVPGFTDSPTGPATRSGGMATQPGTRSGGMAAQPGTRSGGMAAQPDGPQGPQVPAWMNAQLADAGPARTAARPDSAGPSDRRSRGAAKNSTGPVAQRPVEPQGPRIPTVAESPPVRLGPSEPPSEAAERTRRLIEQGDAAQAAAFAADLPDAEPGAATALNQAALKLFVDGRLNEADPLWTRAAALAPDRPNVLLNLARLRHQQGRAGEARLLVRQVLALRPHLTPARQLKAQIEGA